MEVDEEEVALRAQQEKEAKALHKLQKLAHSLKMDPEALHEMDLDAKDARHLLHLGQKTQSICWRRRGLMVSDVELLRKALAWNRLIRRETIRRIDSHCWQCHCALTLMRHAHVTVPVHTHCTCMCMPPQ